MADGRTSAMASNTIRFNSSEIVSKLSDKNQSKKEQNQSGYNQNKEEETQQQEEFVDRSAQLNASLNSLAMINIAKINIKKPSLSNPINNQLNPFFVP